MKLPVQFPNPVDVIAEEAARFRRLSPEDRIRTIRGLLSAGELMIRRSPKADFLRQHAREEKEFARRAVREFIARHAR
jgi:hypothetical protein